jgi:hypothetical protein
MDLASIELLVDDGLDSIPPDGRPLNVTLRSKRIARNRRGPASSLKLFPVDLPKLTDLMTRHGFEDTLECRAFFIGVEPKTRVGSPKVRGRLSARTGALAVQVVTGNDGPLGPLGPLGGPEHRELRNVPRSSQCAGMRSESFCLLPSWLYSLHCPCVDVLSPSTWSYGLVTGDGRAHVTVMVV